jgi:hypothetical protein
MELGNMIFGNSRGEFPVARGLQEIFGALFEGTGLSPYQEFESDVFTIFPYWWGECDKEIACSKCDKLEECPEHKPNFVYKPTGLEIDWYKYPLRDSYSNQEITKKMLVKIVFDCLKSLED